ncbi:MULTISPECIES: hypothetical protein [Paenarthrobacter]|uniref:Ig-like domain-containing protein n=1 Tax=Paenarthrobacter ureafaciens TaxID=37931 RepID=A0AAX3EL89_PAEUR|nr:MULTISPECIES: hypothetical protein [Paenarthrobacter]NKR13534.1 hypothetical protein [Arthrobacter sp. M5]NKR17147.1 hypothetical protein [Arthrobacter sp. M6]OEH61827.1 hypothetical protein A5N13_15725 [Arthrobacter sp. D4]OEH64129.1 hypothetical protein A5N17_06705 [Arthrobacter sp. D2]MDO5863456.1 hypothetical protein [Paenarthrobacter sp. SD-2]
MGRITLGRAITSLLVSGIVSALLCSCAGSPPSLTGNWKADDGTAMKVVMPDGRCKGMYYSGGKPLDIGGGMTCSLSDKKDSKGRYSLVVSQPPNQATFQVEFSGNDSATLYSGSNKLFTMARQ